MPILEGLDGVKKMSKSYDNFISISDEPGDMFGKIMSLSDDLMWRYFELLSFIEMKEILSMKKDASTNKLNPRDAKLKLAVEIVARFYDDKIARKAKDNFLKRFQKKELTEDIEKIKIKCKKTSEEVNIISLLTEKTNILPSTSEARRMIKQNAVKINGKAIDSIDFNCSKTEGFVLQVGKRKFFKITIV